MLACIASYFRFRELKTDFSREILGGVATFLAVVYILSTQMNIMGHAPSLSGGLMSKGGIFVAVVVVSAIGCGIVGIVGRAPVALIPGIGVSAIFTYNVASKPHIGFEGGLIAVMFSALLLVVMSATKIRGFILKAIPRDLKIIIAIGIGFFLTYIGFRDMGMFVVDHGLPVAKLSDWTNAQNYSRIAVGGCLLAVLLALYFFRVKGQVLITIGIGLVISLIIGNVVRDGGVANYFAKWQGWHYQDLSGFKTNIKQTFDQFGQPRVWSQPTLYLAMLVITLVDFFDVSGTIYAFRHQIKTADPTCDLDQSMNLRRVLLADAIGGVANGFVGISNSTVFLESGTGIAEGARTGFSALVVGLGFALCLPLFPLFSLITTALTAPILVFVGFLMLRQIGQVDWKQPEHVIAGLFMILLATATFGITLPIAVTFLVFSLTCLLQRDKRNNLNVATGTLTVIFLAFIVLVVWLNRQ